MAARGGKRGKAGGRGSGGRRAGTSARSGRGAQGKRSGKSVKRSAASDEGEARTSSARQASPGPSKSSGASASTASSPPVAQARAAVQGELLPEGKLYYRIGEVAEITGVKPHVLRYWETEFRWMTPPKSRSKQRLYRRKDIEMILAIKQLLYAERYTIAGARQRLKELGPGRVGEVLAGVGAAPAQVDRPRPAREEGAEEPRTAEALLSRLRVVRGELAALRDGLRAS